jgi:hypothetical protein
MKQLLIFGLIVGFVGTLAGAHYTPWVTYVRVSSQTSVVTNGGRAETFVVRLPVDRIQLAEAAGDWPRAEISAAGPAVEHFKVRNSNGNVVGVASRHWMETPDGATTAWALFIPSRGSLVMAARGEDSGALQRALETRGYRAGTPWDGELTLAMTDDHAETRGVAGSREFVGLGVQYTETWKITGVTEAGDVRGTIELNTISRRGG